MDRQRTQPEGPNTKTAQAPAEPLRPPEVNRVDPERDIPQSDRGRDQRDPTRPHPGSPQTPK